MSSFDVVIAGGGPAGLALAIDLAILGHRLAVVEPRVYPIDKPCGEGIMPEGVKYLERLKVTPRLNKSQISQFAGVCLINARKERAYSYFSNDFGLGCRRLELSRALHERALEFKNISFFNAKAKSLRKASDRMVLATDFGELDARLIVGADGLRSSVRNFAGLAGAISRTKRYGLRQHFHLEHKKKLVEVHFGPGIEAYITPCGPEQINVAFLWTKGRLTSQVEQIGFLQMLELFPILKKELRHAHPLSQKMAIGPLEQKCRSVIADGVALIGDASGYLDAITGEGNSLAFAQAQALANIVNEGLGRNKSILSYKDLKPYKLAHASIVKKYYQNTRLMMWLIHHPPLFNFIIGMAAKSPNAFSWLVNSIRTKISAKHSHQLF